MKLNNQKILVAGMGGTGLSVLAYCRHIGADAAAYDAALNAEQAAALQQRFPEFPLFGGSLADALEGRDVLVLSPGISRRDAAVRSFEERGGKVTGDVAVLSSLLADTDSKIIAITGSNGKTTVTSLVGHLCRESGLDTVVAGNIGTPVLDAWLECAGKAADVWVLELSSFQLETTPDLRARAAVCLNISEDHLDRYDDLLDYARAKDAVFNGCGVQVLNADDAFCRAMKRAGSDVRYFSLNEACDYYLDGSAQQLHSRDGSLLPLAQLPLQGTHNAANVLAAVALCEAVGIARDALLQAVQTFKGLPHRVEKIGVKNGIAFIDDSKGTNVGATVAAIAGLPEKIVLIAGGQGKGQDFTPLKNVVRDKARAVFLIGIDAPKVAADLAGCGVPLTFCDDLPTATRLAYETAQRGDIVLLSPACASFDMFKGYAHRAQVFIDAFHALPDNAV